MFWDWNAGYIFLKIEGTSPAAGMGGDFMYHIEDINSNNTNATSCTSTSILQLWMVLNEVHILVDVLIL